MIEGFLASIQKSFYIVEYLLWMLGNEKAEILYYTNTLKPVPRDKRMKQEVVLHM